MKMDDPCHSNEEAEDIEGLRQRLADAEHARLNELEALRTSLGQLEQKFLERNAELEQKNDALITEIAERERIEDALKESEERLRRMINAVTAYTYNVALRGGAGC